MTSLKSIPLIVSLLGLPIANLFADTLTVNSVIEGVTIYKEGALISRKAKVKVPAGVTIVKVPMLSPVLVQKSLQVGISNADVSLGNVKLDFEIPDSKQLYVKSDSLSKRIGVVKDSFNLLSSLSDVLSVEKNMLLANNNIGGSKGFSAEQLSGVAAYLRSDLTDIANQQLVFNHKKIAYNDLYKDLKQQVRVIDECKLSPKTVLFVSLVSKTAVETEIDIKYLVKKAGWTPFYEVRVSDNGAPMVVKSKAIVSQDSKEDWNDVKMTVTKTNPSSNSEMPRLSRYTLPMNTRKNKAHSGNVNENNMVKVMGVVRDADGPVDGTLVSCSKTGTSVQTNSSGFYELLVPAGSAVSFSRTGYIEERRSVGNDNVKVLNLTLSIKQSDVYSYAETVDVEEEEDDVILHTEDSKEVKRASVDVALMGRVYGIQASTASGQPGAPAKIPIHGTSTLIGSGEPLYIVDGMPWGGGTEKSASSNPLASINPDDIESMEVLKESSSTGIYGARASNGVIVITTKKGAKVGTDLYKSTFASLQDYTTEATGLNSIPADGAEHEASLGEKTLNATFSYYAAPKASPSVYMLAHIPNWREHSLQNGNVRVFLNNNYVGNTNWKPLELKDTLTFSVCIEKDVAVERQRQISKQSKNLIGTSKKVQRDWLIVAKNNKEVPVSLQIQDQIPVSRNNEIKVSLLDNGGAKVDEKSGILTWDVKLSPGERKEFKVSYTVSVKNDEYEKFLYNLE